MAMADDRPSNELEPREPTVEDLFAERGEEPPRL